jgi:hypothetical protein
MIDVCQADGTAKAGVTCDERHTATPLENRESALPFDKNSLAENVLLIFALWNAATSRIKAKAPIPQN